MDSGQINKNPVGFRIDGNIAPVEVSEPSSLGVFTETNCTLTLESAVSVDGNLLVPIKGVSDF